MQLDAQLLAKEIVGVVAAAKKSSRGLVPLDPGAGATADAVLTGLIKVGEQVAAQVCK